MYSAILWGIFRPTKSGYEWRHMTCLQFCVRYDFNEHAHVQTLDMTSLVAGLVGPNHHKHNCTCLCGLYLICNFSPFRTVEWTLLTNDVQSLVPDLALLSLPLFLCLKIHTFPRFNPDNAAGRTTPYDWVRLDFGCFITLPCQFCFNPTQVNGKMVYVTLVFEHHVGWQKGNLVICILLRSHPLAIPNHSVLTSQGSVVYAKNLPNEKSCFV